MRLSFVSVLLLACVAGFLASSGIVTFEGGARTPTLAASALGSSLPVLLAFALPALLFWLALACRRAADRIGWSVTLAALTIAAGFAVMLYARPDIASLLAGA